MDVAKYLAEQGFSVPKIIHHDVEHGFLALEDFGSVSVKDYLLQNANPEEHKRIYHLIIDLLIDAQDKSDVGNAEIGKLVSGSVEPGKPGSGKPGSASLGKSNPALDSCAANKSESTFGTFDNELLASELQIFIDYYIPYAYNRELSIGELEEFMEIWSNILASQDPMPDSFIFRDYHVENMMYLEHRDSIKKIGLLDFQDAFLGSPIYDLVSVLEDARFNVPREDALAYIGYFTQKKELNLEHVLRNYHILGAQRNSRILGVFARKASRDGDDSYIKYIPRVLQYLDYDLSHSSLVVLKAWLEKLK